jgi:hypothetical protein
MTYFCPVRTIIGRAGLTTEFGMGSGVAPHVCSPAARGSLPRPKLSAFSGGRPRGADATAFSQISSGAAPQYWHRWVEQVRKTGSLGLRLCRSLQSSTSAAGGRRYPADTGVGRYIGLPGLTQRIINVVKPSTVSTGRLRSSLALHFPPINLVVYQGSSAHPKGAPSPDLGDGFPLRCLQRLSIPCLATLPCR